MKKLLRNTLCLALTACSIVGLTSCGLSSVEKKAKSYMKDHKESYEGFDLSGNGLKYEAEYPFELLSISASYNIKFDFASSKGSCSATYNDKKVGFNFTCNFDYDKNKGDYEVTKITDGENTIACNFLQQATETEVYALYTIVSEAASAYDGKEANK